MRRVQKFDPSGNFLTKWGSRGDADGQFDKPHGVAVDSFGNVFVADLGNHRIQKFDSSGNFLAKWGCDGSGDGEFGFGGPYGIAVDLSGNLLVADSGNHRIQKFDTCGNFLAKWGTLGSGDGELKFPLDVAVGPWGSSSLFGTWNWRVQKYDSSGRFLAKWGSPGGAPGQFATDVSGLGGPSGIAVDSSGNIYVADTHNARIQVFRRDFGMRGFVGTPDLPGIECDSASGRRYQVWLSDYLPYWASVGDVQPASTTGVNSWLDDGFHALGPPSEARRRLYRVEELP